MWLVSLKPKHYSRPPLIEPPNLRAILVYQAALQPIEETYQTDVCYKRSQSIVASLCAQVGRVLQAIAPGQFPRDEKQTTNYKARVSLEQRQSFLPDASRDATADDIIHRCYTEDPSKKFIRAVNAAPEPAVVVTTDRQLQDIA